MSNSKITVSALALLLAKLQGVDINVLARAANLPRDNVSSWLAGHKGNLRVNSIVALMALLGLNLDAGRWKLDPDRVHFWHLDLGSFTKAEQALAPLMLLSKMLSGTAITRILPQRRSIAGFWRTDYVMLASATCRVVVSIRRPVFRRLDVTPDVVKGAFWRDDNKHHSMLIPATHWAHVIKRDMTSREFDQAFNESLGAMAWGDLALAARQYNLSPEDLMGWIRERHEPADAAARGAAADSDVEVPAGAPRVIALGYSGASEPRSSRTGSYG